MTTKTDAPFSLEDVKLLGEWLMGKSKMPPTNNNPLEKTIQKEIITWLQQEVGCMVLKLAMMRGYGQAGWPDLLILPPDGAGCFIEVKRPGNRTTQLQDLMIKKLQDQGYEVLIASSLDDVVEWWNSFED